MSNSPNWSQGYVPTAGEWNALFASKQDNLNYIPLNVSGGTMSGPLITTASIAGAAGFNIPPGTAPTQPNNGDIWEDNNYLYTEINGQVLYLRGPSAVNLVLRGVNFGAANSDNPVSIPLPVLTVGGSGYTITAVRIANGTGALNSATCGLFTGTGGGGVAIFTGTAITITTGAANTNNNSMTIGPANQQTQALNAPTVYFRVQTPQGGGTVPADVFLTMFVY